MQSGAPGACEIEKDAGPQKGRSHLETMATAEYDSPDDDPPSER
jgi:hypothetical protein